MVSAVRRIARRYARQLFAAVAITTACGAYGAFPAAADTSGGANQVVLAQATAGALTATRSGVQVAPAGSPTVTSSNIAEATGTDCTGCRAAAAALQAIFIIRDADTITPSNAAVAVNSNCTRCDTFAFAYQYVLTTQGPVYLSAAAHQQIAQIREQVAEAVASNLPDDQLDAQLQSLAGEFKAVIDANLQQAGVAAQGTVNERTDAAPAAGQAGQ